MSKKLVCLFIMTVLWNATCKDKAKEEPVVPPVDTTSRVDSSAVLKDDTMPAIAEALGMPPAPKGSGYVVQVASSTDEALARNQIELWKKRGYEPFVSTTTQDNQTHYRVRLGLYPTQPEAKKVADLLADKYSVKALVDEVSN